MMLLRVSVLMSVNLRELQYKDVVDEIGNQVCDCTTEEWAEQMYGEVDSFAL